MWKAAPLFFLVVLDEIEIITFVAVGVLGRRIDAFVFLQDALFPAALWVALLTVMALIWWGRPSEPAQRPYGYVGQP
jgi:hypothetical protein